MARSVFARRGDSIIGIFPDDFERGHIPGRRGTRRTLCTKQDLEGMTDQEKKKRIELLYLAKEHEIKQHRLDERLKIKEKKRLKKVSGFSEVSKIWLDEVKETKSFKTYLTYKNSIDLYIKIVGNHRLTDFDRSRNMEFFKGLNKEGVTRPNKSLSPATQNMHMRQVQNFMNWAYDNEYIDKQFNLKKQNVPKKDMEVFSIDQVNQLAAHLESKTKLPPEIRNPLRHKNLYLAYFMARHTLLRIGHIWSLKLENIDLERGIIRITENQELDWNPKGLKWPSKPINKTLLEFLEHDLKNRPASHRYFLDNGHGQPWVKRVEVISKNMREACNEIGLPKTVKPFHWGIRATFITWLLNKGVPPVQVQQLADHSDLATTMRYFNTRESSQRAAADLLG
jgi:integrase